MVNNMTDYDRHILENMVIQIGNNLELAAYAIDLHLMTARGERISEEAFLAQIKTQIRAALCIVMDDLPTI